MKSRGVTWQDLCLKKKQQFVSGLRMNCKQNQEDPLKGYCNNSGKKLTEACIWYQFSSVQFSHSVVSSSLWPHESQHARPPCPSPSPRVRSDSCASSQWCHPAISSSVVPFCSCPQSLPASESFPVSQLFAWGGQSIGVSKGMIKK